MTRAKFDIEKFDGTGDFGLWRVKMRALLIQHGCEAALEVLPTDMEAQAKAEPNKKAHSAVILCLGNKVLREVTEKTTAVGVWSKLETLYMTKSWANKLYLKKKLYTFYMPAGQKIFEHIDEFNKIILDLTNIEDVMATLNSKEIKERSKAKGDDGEGLYVKGRTDRRDSRYVNKDDQPSSSGSIYDGYEVMMVMSVESLLDWIMDLGGELNASIKEKDSLAQVWHKRLGHISEAGLQVLEKQGQFGKKSLGKLNFCENCVLGKSHRVSFGVGRHTTQGVIDYVHSNLWGPSQVESLGENQTGKTVKKLRTDDGLEFCNREFKQLCIESGIARHLTVAGTPQQNGLAERMNRTLMDKVRCLLIQSRLPKTFWEEATCTAVYLINRSPSTAIEKKTPMEMWSGHPSDYGMLRTFGCVVYSHVQQGKLEPRAVKCVLLGYLEGMKGCRLYRIDNESPKIVTSRNVVFNESVMYKDTLKDSGAGADKSVEELQVEVELQRLNNHTLEEDQTDNEDQTNHDDGNDEDAGDQEIDQPPDLTDYQLVRDREPRIRTKPLRF
nr:retrovirus-related Pol polyprotein from transposon TNT 1-94 [Tanacetum cinerariifolium]